MKYSTQVMLYKYRIIVSDYANDFNINLLSLTYKINCAKVGCLPEPVTYTYMINLLPLTHLQE